MHLCLDYKSGATLGQITSENGGLSCVEGFKKEVEWPSVRNALAVNFLLQQGLN